jgi:quercetin dioxygenase-like cupin family protein
MSMQNFGKIVPVLTIALAALPGARLEAQSKVGGAAWETLMQEPLPEDAAPKISVVSIPVAPAPPAPRPIGAGHTHAGPVFAYILEGKIENQVEPDPPEVYKRGDFFYEAPGHVHRFLRNRSTTASAKLIVFQAGATGQPAPAIKILLEEPLRTTTNQEVILRRLTLPAGAGSEVREHANPEIVYVLEGKVTVGSMSYGAGELILQPGSATSVPFQNASGSEPAKLLLYEVSERGMPSAAR